MLSDVGSAGAFFRRWAFLFLALSVFWFGLHARLEAYKTTSSLSDSKISTEEHSATVLKALDQHDSPADEVHTRLIGCFLSGFPSEATRVPVSNVAKIELADPRRLDLGGVYSLHGPPATNL